MDDNTREGTKMQTLKPGTYIRLNTWSGCYASFDTVRHYAPHNVERSIRNGHDMAFAVYAGAMLVNDPSGTWHKREQARYDGAAIVSDGEIVAIEGEQGSWRVRALPGCQKSPRYSDPIKFDPVNN